MTMTNYIIIECTNTIATVATTTVAEKTEWYTKGGIQILIMTMMISVVCFIIVCIQERRK